MRKQTFKDQLKKYIGRGEYIKHMFISLIDKGRFHGTMKVEEKLTGIVVWTAMFNDEWTLVPFWQPKNHLFFHFVDGAIKYFIPRPFIKTEFVGFNSSAKDRPVTIGQWDDQRHDLP